MIGFAGYLNIPLRHGAIELSLPGGMAFHGVPARVDGFPQVQSLGPEAD